MIKISCAGTFENLNRQYASAIEANYFASDTLRMVRTNIVRNGARLILKKSKMTLGGAVLLRKKRREITPG